MKICIISQQAKKIVSGIGLHTKNLTNALLRDGHEVFLIVPRNQCPDWFEKQKIFLTPDPFWNQNQARWIPLSWYFHKELQIISRYHCFDLIHFTDAREALFTSTKIPMVGNINDTYAAQSNHLRTYKDKYHDYYLRSLYYLIVNSAEKITYPRFQALLANSQYTANTIKNRYQIGPEKIHVCYKSINAPQFQRNKQKAPTDIKTILFVGTNMQRKGLGTIIEAAALLQQKNIVFNYLIVGDDPNRRFFENKCAALGVKEQFNFLGWKSQEELHAIYHAADIFVMPSLEEAFGVVILEAMSAGLVVIGSSVGGIPEIITDKENGFIINPNDPPDLVNKLLHIIQNPIEALKAISGGYSTVNKYTVEKMMQKTYQIYDLILRKSKSEEDLIYNH